MRSSTSKRAAFTLTELVVVVAIFGVLIGLTIPAVMKVRDVAQRVTCKNNLHQIGLALHNYESAHRRIPGNVVSQGLPRGSFGPTWAVKLFPYMGADDLSGEVTLRQPAAGAIQRGRKGAARTGGRRRRRRDGPGRGRRLQRNGGRGLVPPQALQLSHLPVGLLRRLPKPLQPLVHDGDLRQPAEGAALPRARPVDRLGRGGL